jgi:hypothetical protein
MVVIYLLKKKYMKRRELGSIPVRSIHYSRLFLPHRKKHQNYAILITRLAGEVYHEDLLAFAVVLTSLKVLSSEMDPAEIRLIR